MPSPFPGMDPYLEHPHVFPDLYDTLIVYLRSEIQRALPERYVARLGQRTWIEASERPVEPDVSVKVAPRTSSSTAIAALPGLVATEPVVVTVLHDEFSEPFIEIWEHSHDHQQLVAAVEVLSPTNKRLGDRGQALYWQKQTELLEQPVHLIEIDLLRGGRHTTAVSEKTLKEAAPDCRYHVCVRDYTTPRQFVIYPMRLSDSLPNITIPLKPGDPTIITSLQTPFAQAYDDGQFARTINYQRSPPPPPMTDEELAWVRTILDQRSLS